LEVPFRVPVKYFPLSGYYVFRIDATGKGVLPGWPQRLEYVFPGLEPNVDAAFTRKNGKTYIFKVEL
jgi:hypothetical protein